MSTAAAAAEVPSLLVLGGTAFVGRAAVDDALARGWSVSTLNRGRSGGDRPEVQALHADRDDDAAVRGALAGRAYDLVLDVSGLNAARVAATAEALAGSCGLYAYVSTAGVYAEWPARDGLDEAGGLIEADPDDPSPPSMERYSEQKRGGELAALRAFGPDRALIVRPGVIYGPYENVRRCAYWLGRAAAGGPVLVAGAPDRPYQVVDVRDLVAWTLDALERGLAGAFTAVSPPGRDTWGDWIAACAAATGGAVEPVWADDDWLLEQGVEPWSGLPTWYPGGARLLATGRIEAEGFTARPLTETALGAWEALRDDPAGQPPESYRPAGLDRATELALVAAWRARG